MKVPTVAERTPKKKQRKKERNYPTPGAGTYKETSENLIPKSFSEDSKNLSPDSLTRQNAIKRLGYDL